MTTKTELIALVKAVADATGVDAMRVSLGTEGSHVNLGGQLRETGAAWVPEPKPFSILVEGLADWLDSHGVGGPPAFLSIQVLPIAGAILPTTDLAEITAVVAGTLPPASAAGAGQQLVVKAVNAAGASVAPNGGDTIDGVAAPLVLAGAYDKVRLYAASTTEWRTW